MLKNGILERFLVDKKSVKARELPPHVKGWQFVP
jgi:hypothetical protein